MTEIPEKQDNQPKKHLLSGWRFKAMMLTSVVAAFGYLLISLWGGWEDVSLGFSKVGFKGIAVAIMLSTTGYLFRFLRWQKFLHVLGYYVPFWQSFRIYLAGFTLTATPGKAGEVLRSVFLNDYQIPYRHSFGAFIAERISDMNAVILLAVGGLWAYPHARPVVLMITPIIVFIIYAVQKDSWLQKIEQWALRVLPEKSGHVVEFGIETILAFRACFKPKILLYGVLMGCIAWGLEGTALCYLLKLVGYPLSIFTTIFIFNFSLLVGAVSLLPGGLGGTEVAMIQLLRMNDVPTSIAIAVTVMVRLATLWFSVLVGMIALPKKQIEIK